MASHKKLIAVAAAGTALLVSTAAFAQVDAAAAKKLARKDHCLRCHAVETDRKKEGPSYHAIAYKYKGVADAEEKLFKHITSGKKVKLSDGHEEDHKADHVTSEPQLRNLIAWILAQ